MILATTEWTAPTGFAVWIACASFALMLINQGFKFARNLKGPEAHPPNSSLDLRVTTLESEQKVMRETLLKHAAEFTVIRAEMHKDFVLIEERISSNNDAGERRVDGIYERLEAHRKELSEKIDEMPQQIIATLKTTGAI